MAFDSEEKKNDFAAWAEEMTYEEEKSIKEQEKQRLKDEKRAAKEEAKAAKEAAKEEAKTAKAEAKAAKLALKKSKKAKKSETEEAEEEASTEETAEDKSVEQLVAEAAKPEEAEKTAETVSEPESEVNSEEEKSEESSEETVEDAQEEPKEEYNPDYKKEKKKKKPEEINIVKELLSLIIYIGVVIILCYCIITFVGQRTTVHGSSMESTLHDGDNLWIDKLSYHFKDPDRFDIIVFPYEDDVYYIKRVIGLPGETIKINQNGTIMIDGQPLAESYGKEIILDSGTASEERTLGEDQYFVLGDNRNDSRDSRWADVGDIDKDEIIGRAVFRLSPFNKFGTIKD